MQQLYVGGGGGGSGRRMVRVVAAASQCTLSGWQAFRHCGRETRVLCAPPGVLLLVAQVNCALAYNEMVLVVTAEYSLRPGDRTSSPLPHTRLAGSMFVWCADG